MTTPQPQNPNQIPQQPAPQVIYQQPPAKPWYKKPGCMIPLILVILLVLGMGGCMALVGGAATEVDKEMNKTYDVTYKITGDTQDANVHYNVGESSSADANNVASGWETTVKVEGFWAANMRATNGVYEAGSVTCQIIVNGKVLNENTATGELATATCEADSKELKEASK